MAKTRGRPPKKAAEKLTESFLLKLTAAEKADYTAKAEAAGVTLTTWIRTHLNRQRK